MHSKKSSLNSTISRTTSKDIVEEYLVNLVSQMVNKTAALLYNIVLAYKNNQIMFIANIYNVKTS